MRTSLLVFALVLAVPASAQNWLGGDADGTNNSIFRPLDWPAANSYRTGAGTPGPDYWQQRADYVIEARLDTTDHTIHGSERITYHNNSPSDLPFLWVQLDQNVRSREHSRTYQLESAIPADFSPQARQFLELDTFDGGYDLTRVEIVEGRRTIAADYRIDDTIMKINLPQPVRSGETVSFDIDWSYRIPDDGRGAKEMVRDGWLYEMAQWFPRMSVYDDVQGWQTDQFLGQGEFYLNFGNYDVKLTVPWNHIVEATGVLQNDREVLTSEQRSRLARAYQSEEPVFIIAADEVMTPASRPTSSGMQTWHYKAENVRDFAWVSSKTYVWDAAGYTNPGDDDAHRRPLALPARRHAAVGQGLDARHDSDAQDVRRDVVSLSLPQSRQRPRAGLRHGIPDDLLLRSSPRRRWHLFRRPGARADRRDDPRGRPQLVSDDRGVG